MAFVALLQKLYICCRICRGIWIAKHWYIDTGTLTPPRLRTPTNLGSNPNLPNVRTNEGPRNTGVSLPQEKATVA